MLEIIAQYWFETLLTVTSGAIIANVRRLFKQFKAFKLGMQAMLRNEIIEQYNKYIEREYIPIYALENVMAMYEQYHALGGNGTITHLYEELKELPTQQPKRKETEK